MNYKNVLLPVTVIFLGVALLLINMGIIPLDLAQFWPVILVIAGLVGLTVVMGPEKKTKRRSSRKKRKSRKKK